MMSNFKTINKEEFDKQNVFGLGQENVAYAEYFIGKSYLNPLTDAKVESLWRM